jgi:hypothetical protein
VDVLDRSGALVEPFESFVLHEPGAAPIRSRTHPSGGTDAPRANFRSRPSGSGRLELVSRGSGRLTAAPNRITVSEASPGGVVIKHHWVEPLRTSPPLPVGPYPVEGSPVGFVQVENGSVRNFTISPR